MTQTLYLTRNGLLEPLGQSQVIPYLRGLSKDYKITLITYEKAADWQDDAAVARVRRDCEAHGITWLPQVFRPHPKVIAPAMSMIRMIWLVHREVRRRGITLIHARSYIPAAVALAVHRMTGVPFIFDMRALWPEELITARRLKRGTWMHRSITAAERACLKHAVGIVSLTEAAVGHLREMFPDELHGKEITIIPTCADLGRFRPAIAVPAEPVHGCIGTLLSGWFKIDWLRAWIETVAAHDPAARFEILTRDDPQTVRSNLDPDQQLGDKLTISSRNPSEMPEAIRQHTASIMFYSGGETSELGRSPTRMAEVLGSGIPVVANRGVGDVAKIVEEHRVGVLVDDMSKPSIEKAFAELCTLQEDPQLSDRCRATAKQVFSLELGTVSYSELYRKSVATPTPATSLAD